MRNSVLFLLFVLICLQPITSERSRRMMQNRRSATDAKKVVVDKTVVNITTTTSNAKNADKNPHDPELKPVNAEPAGKHKDHTAGNSHGNPVANTSTHLPDMLDEHKLLDTQVFKSLLRDLLSRLDHFGGGGQQTFPSPGAAAPIPGEGPGHINSLKSQHCVLHGLWLSTVAGAAIQLIPEQRQGHIEIHTKIFELPDNPYPPLINSQWTGKGIISQESATTITIVFQEHLNTNKENHAKERGLLGEEDNGDDSSAVIQLPRTAVFIGQCLVCHGNPTLQGAWVVFPASQTCNAGAGFNTGNGVESQSLQTPDSLRLTTPDSIYLLSYY